MQRPANKRRSLRWRHAVKRTLRPWTKVLVLEAGTDSRIVRCSVPRRPIWSRLEDMAIDIKLSRINNTPWGFRLSGGADFPHPLTVVRVARGSLADDAGLRPGDVLIRLNNSPLQDLTHAQAHDWLLRAANNFVITVVRNHRIATQAQ